MFQLEDNEMTKQEQVSRSLGKDFMGGRWWWRPNVFQTNCFPWINGVGITVRFECTLSVVRAIIDTADDYGLPNEQQEFQGENAIGKCLAWAAEKVVENSEIISGRVKPYRQGHKEYLRALKGA